MNRCADCKHWRGPTTWNTPYFLPPGTVEHTVDLTTGEMKPLAPRPYGMCDRVRDNGEQFRLIQGKAELETHQDFGCTQWEAK